LLVFIVMSDALCNEKAKVLPVGVEFFKVSFKVRVLEESLLTVNKPSTSEKVIELPEIMALLETKELLAYSAIVSIWLLSPVPRRVNLILVGVKPITLLADNTTLNTL
jgi:hypothetical protein